jgi:mono/diheme cytochrome c family protein
MKRCSRGFGVSGFGFGVRKSLPLENCRMGKTGWGELPDKPLLGHPGRPGWRGRGSVSETNTGEGSGTQDKHIRPGTLISVRLRSLFYQVGLATGDSFVGTSLAELAFDQGEDSRPETSPWSGVAWREGPTKRKTSVAAFRHAALLVAALFLAGCHTDMWVQPKTRPFQQDDFFADTNSSRDPIPGTIARGRLRLDKAFYTGYDESGKLVDKLPAELTLNNEKLSTKTDMAKVLTWGRERFTAFCSECHGALGDGKGMITQRGLILRRSPANYHTDRLRAMPLGHFYDVQTNGFGIMNSSASRVSPDERWAIAAYIRALQLSKHAKPSDLTPEEASALEKGGKQ